jgi:uncharacterized protein YggE
MLPLLALLVAAVPTSVQAQERPLVPSLTVVGSGKVSARPDMAQIQVGVVSEAASAAKALKDNNEAMARLFSALEGHGIAKKDTQTSNFSVIPQYKQGKQVEQPQRITGYRVSNTVRIKVRKLDTLGQILDDVVQQGANQVHSISFSVAESAPLLDEARRKAMADARRKAELYAKEAGVDVGKVLLIQEQTPHVSLPPVIGFARAESAGVPIAEGEMEFGASITVTYAIAGKS